MSRYHASIIPSELSAKTTLRRRSPIPSAPQKPALDNAHLPHESHDSCIAKRRLSFRVKIRDQTGARDAEEASRMGKRDWLLLYSRPAPESLVCPSSRRGDVIGGQKKRVGPTSWRARGAIAGIGRRFLTWGALEKPVVGFLLGELFFCPCSPRWKESLHNY